MHDPENACRRTKSGKLLPGPSFAVPLVGGVAEMVLNPFKFWEDQRKTSFPGMTLLRAGMTALPDLRPRPTNEVFAASDFDSLRNAQASNSFTRQLYGVRSLRACPMCCVNTFSELAMSYRAIVQLNTGQIHGIQHRHRSIPKDAVCQRFQLLADGSAPLCREHPR